ncbi:MAG: ABC transporter permease [Cyclobacteriaceae bacterium]|nr:ABC transporter permease [Cyclobacteriaceae bacterium]
MMILKIAWRNVWRSKGRSFVVMSSIVVGIWALIVGNGFMNGFMVGYMDEAINYDISNIQVHHPEFKQDFDINLSITDGLKKTEEIREWEGVEAVTTRTIVNGMIASTKKASGIQIRGIDKKRESEVTSLDSLIKEGAYFEGIKRNPIVIGAKLAENLKVKLRQKVVLTFNDSDGNITSAAFRVAGIVKSSSLNINERYAYVLQSDINTLLGIGDEIHEIAMLTSEGVHEGDILTKYNNTYSGDLVEDWKLIAPEMALMQEMYGSMLYVLMFIILTALIFGIINTMLMAVLERLKELGMLMAVGMNKLRVFIMILVETLSLAIISSPVGLFISFMTISYYRNVGVDLTNYSEGLEAFGYASILYPFVAQETYIVVTVGVIITSFLAAIYPAWKAVKLKPVEALHKI